MPDVIKATFLCGFALLAACAPPPPNNSSPRGVGFGDVTDFTPVPQSGPPALTGPFVDFRRIAEEPQERPLVPLRPIAEPAAEPAQIPAPKPAPAPAPQPRPVPEPQPRPAPAPVPEPEPQPQASAVTLVDPDGAPLSDEQDFDAVAARETIESDRARIERNRQAYQIIQPGDLPVRPGETGPSIVEYALATTHPVGTKLYLRSGLSGQRRFDRNCAKYASSDRAQSAFLSSGGPSRDRFGLDPDGDGYACYWDPTPFRAAVGR